jgi:deazaflavin-dependent oxidoreductase (nitroreductase family)
MAGGAQQPLPQKRRKRGARDEADAARRLSGNGRVLADADHDRPEVRGKFVFPLYYGTTGESYIIVASKGGAPDHPGWYKNLVANPEVEVRVGTKKLKAKARTVTGEERAKLWPVALKFWPPYADYAKKTEREIPVVVLDPV